MKTTFYEVNKLSTFLASKKTLLAQGAMAQAGPEAAKLGAGKVLMVTDAGVVKAGLAETARESLSRAGLEVGVFDGILPEPPARVIDQCADVFRQGGYDLCLGLGGGSSLDSAKMVAALAANPGPVLDYVGLDMLPKRGAPLILVPTTAGTGSEATRVAVLTDESDNTKKVVYSDYLLPDVSILDPALTLSMPPSVTADTGLDALVHAIETYVSVNTTPYAEILSLQAIAMIARHLPQAHAKAATCWPATTCFWRPIWPDRPLPAAAWARCTAWPTSWAPNTTWPTAAPTPSCCPMSWPSTSAATWKNTPTSPRPWARTPWACRPMRPPLYRWRRCMRSWGR